MLLENSILIDCPQKPLYQLISDLENHIEILPGYLESKVVERKEESFVIERKAIINGRFRQWKSEVSMDKGVSVHYRQLEGPLEGMRVHWNLTPRGQATELCIVHDIQVKSWWKKWWMERWVAKPAIEKTVKLVLEATKRTAEER